MQQMQQQQQTHTLRTRFDAPAPLRDLPRPVSTSRFCICSGQQEKALGIEARRETGAAAGGRCLTWQRSARQEHEIGTRTPPSRHVASQMAGNNTVHMIQSCPDSGLGVGSFWATHAADDSPSPLRDLPRPVFTSRCCICSGQQEKALDVEAARETGVVVV